MSSPDRLTAFALSLATASLLVAAYAVLSRPAASQTTPTCSCEDPGVQEKLASLERRVDAAERTAAHDTVRRAAEVALEPARDPSVGGDPPASDTTPAVGPEAGDDDPAENERRATPRFVDFEISEAGVDVSQAEDGALSVRNTNAALAGQVVTVRARGEDGKLHEVPITVPPVL